MVQSCSGTTFSKDEGCATSPADHGRRIAHDWPAGGFLETTPSYAALSTAQTQALAAARPYSYPISYRPQTQSL